MSDKQVLERLAEWFLSPAEAPIPGWLSADGAAKDLKRIAGVIDINDDTFRRLAKNYSELQAEHSENITKMSYWKSRAEAAESMHYAGCAFADDLDRDHIYSQKCDVWAEIKSKEPT